MALRRGDIAKQTVTDTILKAFGDAIVCVQDKKIFININEGSEVVQVAVSLTCPKTAVAKPDGLASPTEDVAVTASQPTPVEISQEDKEKVIALKKMLGITT